MPFRSYWVSLKTTAWPKVISLAMTLLFVFLADAILSYWVPNYLNRIYQDSAKAGLVMAVSSIIGLGADLILPQIIRGITVRRLVFWGIVTSALFSIFLLGATVTPLLIISLSAMAIWGIYYELLGFAQQQFVADATPIRFHPAAWGILGVFKSLAYFLGPIIAGGLMIHGERTPLFLALGFALVSFIHLTFQKGQPQKVLSVDTTQVSLWREFEHWKVLLVHVWPVVAMSVVMGLIDAFFWTIGAIWTEKLLQVNALGGMFLSVYILPSMFMGFVVAKWGIYQGKKKMAIICFALSGAFMALIGVSANVYWQILTVLVSSILLSVVYPLVEGVYSDIVGRMGRERHHMIGLSNSTSSLAYIVGPPLSGVIAGWVGERQAFAVMGLVVVAVSVVLFLTTPRKLRLPQEAIKGWD